MATIKSYTTIEQSRKLAEILPLESADLKWFFWMEESNASKSPSFGYSKTTAETYKDTDAVYLPCWSLSALLGVLPVTATLLKDGNISDIGDVKYSCECSMVNIHKWFDNPIDACYELILKLHELNIL